MNALIRGLGLLAAIAVVTALPAVASAQGEGAVIPPGNSAAHQYTEPYPTSRGNKNAYETKGRDRSPRKVLGNRDARRLESHGADGQAAAELAAVTAPVVELPGEEGYGSRASTSPASPGDGNTRGQRAQPTPQTSGSSGPGLVIAQATGLSSGGGLGIVFPLLILATILWAGAYLARQKRPAE